MRGLSPPRQRWSVGGRGQGVVATVPPQSSGLGGSTPTPATPGLGELPARWRHRAVRTRLGQWALGPPQPKGRLTGTSPPPPHLPPLPRVPRQARVGRSPAAGAGRGRGGSRRRNHKAASQAGKGHSHKTDPLPTGGKGVFTPRSVLKRPQHRPEYFQLKEYSLTTPGETETRILGYRE